MRSPDEVPLPNSVEGMMLRAELKETFQANAQIALIINDYDTLEDLEYPTEIFLGGKLTSRRQGMAAVVGLLTWRLNDQEATTIVLDGHKYEVADDGIRHAAEPKEPLDDETIMRLRYWLDPRRVKWSRGLTLRVPKKFQETASDDLMGEDEDPEYEVNQAECLRWDLDQLFDNHSAEIESLLDDKGPKLPDVKFLGGLIKSGEPNGYANIDVVRWEDDSGLKNTSITVDSYQYLITGSRIVFADSQDEELNDADIIILRSWVQPEAARWFKVRSKRLANHQLEIYETWERQV